MYGEDYLLQFRNTKSKKIHKHGIKGSTGMHWYNNGFISILDFECPSGFKLGRLLNASNNNLW
jgi:hypothetical protein